MTQSNPKRGTFYRTNESLDKSMALIKKGGNGYNPLHNKKDITNKSNV